MKIFIIIFICFCTFNSSGQSQAEMNDLAMNEYSISLNIKDSIAKEIRKTYQNDTEFLLSFRQNGLSNLDGILLFEHNNSIFLY